MARVIPLYGPDDQRAAAAQNELLKPHELHSTTDGRRLFLENVLVGAVYHGEIASETAMLALNTTSTRGCWPGDFCWRSDLNKLGTCAANRGGAIEDWILVGGSDSIPAANVTLGAITGISADNVQAALAELQTEKSPTLSDSGAGSSIIADAAAGSVKKLRPGLGIALTEDATGVEIEATAGAGVPDSDALIQSFDPVAWYKADVGVLNSSAASAADAEEVQTWQDQSGNDHHLEQGTSASRPTFRVNVQNSLPAVRFDGVNDYLLAGTFPSIDLRDFCAAWVVKTSSAAEQVRYFVVGASGSGNDYNSASKIETEAADGGVGLRMQGSDMNVSINGPRPHPFAVLTARIHDSDGLVRKNDSKTSATDNSIYITNSDPGLLMGTPYTAGAVNTSGGQLNGDFAELAIFSPHIGDTGLAMVASALMRKWGV